MLIHFIIKHQISKELLNIMTSKQHILTVLILFIIILITEVQGTPTIRVLEETDGGFQSQIEVVVNYSIELLSKVINFLKRVLVLMTLLFLIESLINFWVLASSYAFLAVQMPEHFKSTISDIYTLYNESFLHYIGLDIHYPNLTVKNQIYSQLSNSELYQFNAFQFALEPTILLVLTLIELSVFKWVLRVIKNRARQNRQEYLKGVIEVEARRKQKKKNVEKEEKKKDKNNMQRGKQQGLNVLANLFKSNKVANESISNTKRQKPQTNFMLQLTYKIMQQNMKEQLSKKNYKHWSEDIHINKMEKVAALIINFMTGLLMPSFSLLFENRLSSFWEKINALLYFLLLGLIFLFPFLYISRNVRSRTKQGKGTLRSSDIQTLSQYFLNMCMSVTLGIRNSSLPFLITTFSVLSLLLVSSFMEGGSSVSCYSMTMKKVNSIVHRLTFWLYNLVFVGMCVLMRIKQNSEDPILIIKLQGYAQYCSFICLGLFLIGGSHELLQFALGTVVILFKVIHIVFMASSKEEYQESEGRDEISEVLEAKKEREQELHEVQEEGDEENIFNLRAGEDESQSEEIARAIKRQIAVHEIFLEHLKKGHL